jgi:carboxylesterase type B
MRWVQANAALLNADPNRVMIFGESAGAGSVSNHLVREESWPYFRRAAMESGPFADWSAQPLSWAAARTEQIARNVGCDPNATKPEFLKCMRAVNSTALQEGIHDLPYSNTLCEW